jgi:hypothetical protein
LRPQPQPQNCTRSLISNQITVSSRSGARHISNITRIDGPDEPWNYFLTVPFHGVHEVRTTVRSPITGDILYSKREKHTVRTYETRKAEGRSMAWAKGTPRSSVTVE